MMEISLSTHLFVFNDLDETIASMFGRFGFSSAELWAMPPHFPYGDTAEADRIADILASKGVRIASVHAPLYPDVRTYRKDRWFSLSSGEEEHRLASVAATAKAARWLSHRGGGTMVVHTNFPAEKWYPRRWAAFLSSLNELLASVSGNVRFAVENTPLPSGRVEVILDIVHRHAPERVGLCLDLGHANIQENVQNAIRAAGERLIHIHASDNHAVNDDHFVPGRGSIAWDRAVGALREVGFDGAFTVELRDYTRGEGAFYKNYEEILAECSDALARVFDGGR
jgi:sugar phosphate isomerase/epimerase